MSGTRVFDRVPSAWHGPVLSIAEAVISSAIIFLLQIVILFGSSKTEFGQFSLAYSYVIMGQMVLSAAFGAPLLTVLAGLHDPASRRSVGGSLLQFQMVCAIALALVAGVAGLAFGQSLLTICLVAAGFFTLGFRDAVRNQFIAQGRVAAALLMAVRFGAVLSILSAGYLAYAGSIDHLAGLAIMAMSSALANLGLLGRTIFTRSGGNGAAKRQLLGLAAWSFPGVVVIWLQNNFYLTLIALSVSIAAVADVSAARMVVMPILVASAGVMRFVQVRFAENVRANGIGVGRAQAARLAWWMLGLGAAAAAAAQVAVEGGVARLVPGAYDALPQIVVVWLLFCGATIARSIWTSLFQSQGFYRQIFLLNLIVLPIVIGGILVLPPMIGIAGAILPLAFGELALLALMVLRLRKI